ncbi:uncharacterized protein LOC131604336 [Vicia villosa]|uniref:uncharacterized protein LOC131604336 n=1 Tax=Vicia villosa TaxID=3911 RepID=UPI00273B6222|nr:uncharacterized protein LOC131604336 [Vicia villosa]
MAESNNHTANSSSLSQPRGGDINANVIRDNPLSHISHGEQDFFMVGTISVPLYKNKKNTAPALLECISSSNHSPYPTTSTDYEQSKFKRRNRVNLHDNKTLSVKEKFTRHHNESPHRSHFWKKDYNASADRRYNKTQRKFNNDICFRGKRNSTLTRDIPLEKNEENGIEFEMQEEGTNGGILRPGMVLLKHHLTHHEQVEIVKNCRDLGLGPGGFYQPGYGDGAKLRLMMMCLGMDWDPQTRKYGYKRVIDGSKPPSIPPRFSKLVTRAIQEAHQLYNRECGISYVEDILPSMTPDICIVNFYSTTGRLGLHQDRDESKESLRKGLPVVSFSIGDSAEFLYGDQRDVEKAENVVLESGDVLIFGGDSRHVYHGVSSIIPNSAPEELVKDTGLCPGRLNLTFRQY